MSKLLCHLLKSHTKSFLRNGQHVRHAFQQGAYEGEGKTTVTLMNRDMDYGVMIDKITMRGFVLNLGANVLGPMIIFPRTVIGWNIASTDDINEDSLALFKLLDPKPDIILLGLDKEYPRDTPFLRRFKELAQNLNVTYEILPVDKACTTFNFLNAEKRYAVGALLPPQQLDYTNEDNLIDMGVRRYLYQPWEDTEEFEDDDNIQNKWMPKDYKKLIEDSKSKKKLIPENVPPPKTNQ